MGRIVYSVAGEGRGHAARCRALTEVLAERHEVLIYAAAQAEEMLAPVYGDHPRVEVRPVKGLEFVYGPDKRVDYVRTLATGLPLLLNISEHAAKLEAEMVRFGADLVITDFEPIAPRAAYNTEIPFITVDHQSFLVHCDLSGLPTSLQAYAAVMAPVTGAWYPSGRVLGLVSSFFEAPLRAEAAEEVRQIGVLLRPEVRNAVPTEGEHLLAYLRRDGADGALDALGGIDMPVKVYGLGERPARRNLTFCPVSALGFVEDLASCQGLVCTAGNQLIGEAIHLGKPCLAMPEKGNFEQQINAHFIRELGAGMICDLDALTVAAVQTFLASLPSIRARQKGLKADGTAEAAAWVDSLLTHPVEAFEPIPEVPPVEARSPWRPAALAAR
jgi:uncharacterized protein (TIGR00661 family)